MLLYVIFIEPKETMKKITLFFICIVAGCFTSNAQITVNSATVCATSSATLTASGASTYTWSPATGLNTTTGAAVKATPTATTTYTVIGTVGLNTYTATSVVTVNPRPNMTSASSATICSGNAVNLALTTDIASTFNWKATAVAHLSGESTSTKTLTTISDVITNSSASPQTVSYTVTPTATSTLGGCTGTAQLVNVTVNPAPTLTNNVTNAVELCSGQSVNFPLGANIPATFTWIAAVNTNIFGESTTLQNSSTITDTLSVSPTGGYQNVYFYTITPISTVGCSGTSKSLEVTVWPAVILTGTLSKTICSGSNVNFSFSSTGETTKTYTWIATNNTNVSGESTTLQYGVSPTGITDVLVNTTLIPQQVIYSVTPSSDNTGHVTCVSPVQTVTITVDPVATITVTPLAQTICSGTALSIPITTDIGTFTWKAANNPNTTGESTSPQSSSAITNTLVNTSDMTQTVSYTVTATTSSTLGACASTQFVNVVVDTKNPSVMVNSATVCAGVSATLTAAGASSYSWLPATGLNTTTGATVIATPTVSTSYTVSATNTCTTIVVVSTVTVNSLSVTATSATVCNGQSGTLTASGAATYVWSTGATTISITASPTVTTTYSVTGTSSAGCTDVVIKTITVNSLPQVTVSPTAIPLCSATSDTLTASGASSYAWSPATGLNTTTGATVIAAPSVTTTYTVTGTSGAGCTNTAMASVTPPPTVTVSSATICAGDTTILAASGANSYSWLPSTNLTIFGNYGDSVTINPSVTSTYTITANLLDSELVINGNFAKGYDVGFTADYFSGYFSGTGRNGGNSLANGNGNAKLWENSPVISIQQNTEYHFSMWIKILVPDTALQVLKIYINNNLVDTLILNTIFKLYPETQWDYFNFYYPYTEVTFNWNSGTNDTADIRIMEVIPGNNSWAETRIDDISFRAMKGCSSTAVTTVVVNPAPTITITSTPEGSTTLLTATNNPGYTYAWSTGSTTNTALVPTPATDSVYTVNITGTNGCGTTDTIVVDSAGAITLRGSATNAIVVEKTTTKPATNFVLYPNPSNGTVTLNYTLTPSDNGFITVYDMYGRSLFSSVLDNSDDQLKINNDQLADGVYIYRVTVNAIEVKTEKIILIK